MSVSEHPLVLFLEGDLSAAADVRAALAGGVSPETMADATVAALKESTAAFWNRSLELMYFEFDRASIPLAECVLRVLLRGDGASREPWFRSLRGYAFESLLVRVVGGLSMTLDEILAVTEAPAGESPRALSAVVEWAREGGKEAARIAVDSALVGTAATLSRPLIAAMIEGVASEAADSSWSSEVLRSLIASPNETDWALAVRIAPFAHPRHVSVEARITCLERLLDHSPRRLAPHALIALRRLANEHPSEAVRSALRVVDSFLTLTDRPEEIAGVAASATELFALAINEVGAEELKQCCELSFHTPPGRREFDLFLHALWKRAPEEVIPLLRSWVYAHAPKLTRSDGGLDQLLPMFVDAVGSGWVGARLVEYLTAKEEALRRAGGHLAGEGQSVLLDDATISGLQAEHAQAMAHQILGSSIRAERYVDFVFALADARGDLAGFLADHALEIVDNYPATVSSVLQSRRVEGNTRDPEVERLHAALQAQIDSRLQSLETINQIPELRARGCAHDETLFRLNQLNRRVADAARKSGRFVWAQIVTQIPIACGEGTIAGEVEHPFSTFDFSTELPRERLLDESGWLVKQLLHLQAASRLLGSER